MSGVSRAQVSRGVLLLLIRLCSPGRRIVLLRLAGYGRAWRFAAAPLMRPPLMNSLRWRRDLALDETSPAQRSRAAPIAGVHALRELELEHVC